MGNMLVLGASGGMGYSIVNDLVGRGHRVTAFARNRKKLEKLFKNNERVTIVSGDLFQLEDVLEAAKNTEIIFHAASIPYFDWSEKLPIIMNHVLEAAKQRGTKLALVDNIYAYGKQREKVTENTPKMPHTKKGKIRLQLENMVKSSGVDYVIAHFPDFYGPGAENTVLHFTLENIVKKKKSFFVGDQKVGREYLFTPDGAKALVTLALTEKAYGQNWNIPGYGAVTGEELIGYIREFTAYDKKITTATKGMVRLLGLFDRNMREVTEMFYLFQQPVFLSGEKYEREIGPLPKTSYKEGLKQTLEYLEKKGRKRDEWE